MKNLKQIKTFLDKVEKLHFDPVLTPFCPKSQEPEFCQTWGFHQKKRITDLYQHVEYLKKQMKTFLDKVRKLHFDPVLTPFFPISREPEFCQTCGFHQKKRIIDLYQHVQYLKKQMKNFRENSEKLHFDPLLTLFWPISGEPGFCWPRNFTHTSSTIRAPFWQKISKI